MELKELRGSHILQGVDISLQKIEREWYGTEIVQCIKFTLDGVTYVAYEDPSDGYRSYCGELQISDTPCETLLPNVEVVCVYRDSGVGYYSSSDILEFIDSKNGKTVLLVGTNNDDDYYPFCVFEYTPENLSCNESVSD